MQAMSFVAAPTDSTSYMLPYGGIQYGAPQASLGSAYASPMMAAPMQGYGQMSTQMPAMGMASYQSAQPQYAMAASQAPYAGGQAGALQPQYAMAAPQMSYVGGQAEAAQPQYAMAAPQMSYIGGQAVPAGSYMPSQAMYQQQVMQPSMPMSEPAPMTTPAPNDMALQSAPSMIAYPGMSPMGMATTAPQETFSGAPVAAMPEPATVTLQETVPSNNRVSSKKRKGAAGKKKRSGGCC